MSREPARELTRELTREQIVKILERNYGSKAEVARRAKSQRKAGGSVTKTAVTRWCDGLLDSASIYSAAFEVASELLKSGNGKPFGRAAHGTGKGKKR